MINVRDLDAINLSLVAGAFAFAFASAGCDAEADDADALREEGVASVASAIVGGQPTTDYAAVGALTRRGSSFCTGTLVAKRLVVTAAHCLQGLGASNVRFALGPTASAPRAELDVARVVPHLGFDAQRLTNDIGALVLSEDAPAAPIPINGAMSSSWVGRALTFVGYGVTSGFGGHGSGVKREVDIAVSEVGPTQFAYEDLGKNTCFGDSGGPAFAKDSSGALTIVGVTSYGDRTCTQFGVDTRVDAFRSWLASVQR